MIEVDGPPMAYFECNIDGDDINLKYITIQYIGDNPHKLALKLIETVNKAKKQLKDNDVLFWRKHPEVSPIVDVKGFPTNKYYGKARFVAYPLFDDEFLKYLHTQYEVIEKEVIDTGIIILPRLDESMNESLWQPIETAPKDGTQLILLHKHYSYKVSHRIAGGFYEFESWVWPYRDYTPTHWMYVPELPN